METIFKTSIWLCTDLSGEHVFKSKPIRWKDKPGNLKDMELWVSRAADEESLTLPKGSIFKLIGKDLTWSDDPLELNEEVINKHDIKSQYNTVYNNLFIGGGLIQARDIICELMKNSSLDEIELLGLIQRRIDELKHQKSNGICEKARAEYILEKHKNYLCVDNNYKLCIRKIGDERWDSVKLIFPYLSTEHISHLLGPNITDLW